MFTEAEIKKFQNLADEMAQLIENPDGTSNEASVAYGKIVACIRTCSSSRRFQKRTTSFS